MCDKGGHWDGTTWNNTETETHLLFFFFFFFFFVVFFFFWGGGCLIQSWPQLYCNDIIVATTGLVRVQAVRRNGHCSLKLH